MLIALGAGLLLLWGVRVVQAGLSLRRHLAEAEALIRSPEAVDLTAACALVRALRRDVEVLHREAGVLASLGPTLGGLPQVGGDLSAVPHLLAMADGLTEAGVLGCDGLGSIPAAGRKPSFEEAIRWLAERRPEIARARAAVGRAEAAWRRLDSSRLSPRVARWVASIGQLLPWLRAGLDVAAAAPDLLGMNGPRVYLIIAQNEDERRPAGGYITGVGEIRIENGRVVTMTFRDSYAVDNFSRPYPDPPEPLRRYMGIDLWVFRDSNWSPDFPTAARQALALYRPGYEPRVDGVIAVDQYALREMVAAVGSLTVAGVPTPITADGVIPYIRQAWAPEDGRLSGEWWRQRKSFMGPLAEALWARLQGGDVDGLRVARTVIRLMDEKHLLLYVPHPSLVPLLAERGWDGALRPGGGDFLMVVDANVGYNKASAKVQQSITYEVDLRHRPPRAMLTLVYTHTATRQYPCVPEVRYDPVYEQMMDRCYWDYLRVYIPQGSRLLDSTRIPIPGEALWSRKGESGEVAIRPAEEGPWLSVETLLLLPPGAVQSRFFVWELPDRVVVWQGDEGTYTLRVQKQPGTVGHPLTMRIHLDPQDRLLEVEPLPTTTDGSTLIFQTHLNRDQALRIRFRRGG